MRCDVGFDVAHHHAVAHPLEPARLVDLPQAHPVGAAALDRRAGDRRVAGLAHRLGAGEIHDDDLEQLSGAASVRRDRGGEPSAVGGEANVASARPLDDPLAVGAQHVQRAARRGVDQVLAVRRDQEGALRERLASQVPAVGAAAGQLDPLAAGALQRDQLEARTGPLRHASSVAGLLFHQDNEQRGGGGEQGPPGEG